MLVLALGAAQLIPESGDALSEAVSSPAPSQGGVEVSSARRASVRPLPRVEGNAAISTPAPTPRPPAEVVLQSWAPPPTRNLLPAPGVTAASAIVIDEASGAVLWEKDPHRQMAPASVTKIATAVIALQEGNLDAPVTVDVDYQDLPGSSVMGLLPGDTFTLRDLLYGLMLPSGNDAAIAIGRHLAVADDEFVAKMNVLALRLGMYDTQFANPHGLGSRQHYTTASDLAVLSRYAMSVPGFEHLALASDWTAFGSRVMPLTNFNTLLGAYEGADGVKVGYTERAGNTMVASATRDGHRVFVVLLNAPKRDEDAIALLDWSFAAHSWP
jgi:serine-type D-Ala-D-Ala carboxypeptidase (penicillin-binding protein 5/6)